LFKKKNALCDEAIMWLDFCRGQYAEMMVVTPVAGSSLLPQKDSIF